MRHLLKTLWLALDNIGNAGMLLVLIYFVFAVAGMQLFGDLQLGDFVTDNANFQTFYIALNLMFRASTGENWNGYMHDCITQKGGIGAVFWIAQ